MPSLDYELIYSESVKLLQKLIQNRCENFEKEDSGNEIKSVNPLIEYFGTKGITDYEIFESAPTRGSILIKIQGTDVNTPSLMYQSHLDVVPATDGWTVDPFEGLIKDGWLFGRGALDMLYYTATQAVAFAHLLESGWKPKGDFYYLAIADEEGGGEYGAKWLIENVSSKIQADYLISEFGGTMMTDADGNMNSTVMIAEKGVGWSKLEIRGEPGHGSTTYNAINAIEIASEILLNIQKSPPKTVITPAYSEFISQLNIGTLKEKLVTNSFFLDRMLIYNILRPIIGVVIMPSIKRLNDCKHDAS